MGIFRQEYQNGLPFPPPGDLPDSGIKPMKDPMTHELQADSLPTEPLGKDMAIGSVLNISSYSLSATTG